ncbi:MAG: hypothetical protein V7724_09045 [Sediminicola sp.]|tara:strand:+ start:145120 stop:145428 length:309 start_codon:yes stop_codon:yes gene_type:complete
MVKIFLVAILAMGSLTACAQEVKAEKRDRDNASATNEQEGFSEIKTTELPKAITAAISKNYPTARISKAQVNEAEQYKLEVSLEDGTKGLLYADNKGNWIDM